MPGVVSCNGTDTDCVAYGQELQALVEWVRAYHQVETYVLFCVIVCGVSGNILSFLVFTGTTLIKLPSSVYLSALSLVDTVFLLTLMPLALQNMKFNVYSAPFICYAMVYMSYCTSFLSIWFVTLFMVERYIVVCHPLKASFLCSRRRSLMYVVLLIVLAFMMYSYTLGGISVEVNMRNNSTRYCRLSIEYLGPQSAFTYVDTALSFIVPFSAVFCFNIRVIIAIRSVRRDNYLIHSGRRAHTMLSKVQFRLTLTLIIVSFTFLTLLLPSHIVRIFIVVLQLKRENVPLSQLSVFQKLQNVSQLLSYLNYCMNFAIYSASSPLFRSGITQLLMRLKGRHNSLGPRETLLRGSDVSEHRTYMETPL